MACLLCPDFTAYNGQGFYFGMVQNERFALSSDDRKWLVSALYKKTKKIAIFLTICRRTEERGRKRPGSTLLGFD